MRYYYLSYLVNKDDVLVTGGMSVKGKRKDTIYLISGARKKIKQVYGASPAILGVVRISKKDYEVMQRMDREEQEGW